MKTHSFFKAAAVLLALLSVRGLYAQSVTKLDTLHTVVITSTTLVNKSVTAAFAQQFNDAANPRWYALAKKYLVKFISKDQKNHALYNNKGSLIYHIAYVDASNIPQGIQSQINYQYPLGVALTAIHVDQDARSIWMVNLKVGADFVLVSVEGDTVEEIDRYSDTVI